MKPSISGVIMTPKGNKIIYRLIFRKLDVRKTKKRTAFLTFRQNLKI